MLPTDGDARNAIGDRAEVIHAFLKEVEAKERAYLELQYSDRKPENLRVHMIAYLRAIEAAYGLATNEHLGLPFQELIRSLQSANGKRAKQTGKVTDRGEWLQKPFYRPLLVLPGAKIPDQRNDQSRMWFQAEAAALLEYGKSVCLLAENAWAKNIATELGKGGLLSNRGTPYSGASVLDWRDAWKKKQRADRKDEYCQYGMTLDWYRTVKPDPHEQLTKLATQCQDYFGKLLRNRAAGSALGRRRK
jgi:hypothetical protein